MQVPLLWEPHRNKKDAPCVRDEPLQVSAGFAPLRSMHAAGDARRSSFLLETKLEGSCACAWWGWGDIRCVCLRVPSLFALFARSEDFACRTGRTPEELLLTLPHPALPTHSLPHRRCTMTTPVFFGVLGWVHWRRPCRRASSQEGFMLPQAPSSHK